MAIREVYKNPTVKEVIFQIKFPTFFSMESKIGDFQLKIMERFPQSSLLTEATFLIASSGDVSLTEKEQSSQPQRIWQFKNQDGSVTVSVKSDSLSIVSSKHKTYNNESADKFRDIICFVAGKFLELIPLFQISRMGLRYKDECPLPAPATTETFLTYYNSFINFSNLPQINETELLNLNSVVKIGDMTIRYGERLSKIKDNHKYELDFDGQVFNIKPANYLDSLDRIHDEISLWYERIIKEPVINLMKV